MDIKLFDEQKNEKKGNLFLIKSPRTNVGP